MPTRQRLLLLIPLVALIAVSHASGGPGDEYTATGGPAYVKPSTKTTFTIVLTNKSPTSHADRAKIGIPTGFTVDTASVQASTTAAGTCVVSTWTNDGTLIADGKINLRWPGGGPSNRLCPGATLTVTFAATAANEGAAVWATELLRDQDAFVLTGPQPSVTVDGTSPTVTITSHPPNPSNNSSPSFAFSANEPADFECKLDAGAFAACSSPKSYSTLADGSHTFTVRATDAAGNTGSASYTWMIETTLPTVTLAAKPVSASNSSSASFSFTSSKPATFECKLDAGAFASCTSPVTYTGLADGGHTFAVRAIDAANNTGPETTYAWTVDTIAPAAAITDKPPNPSNDASPTFAFSASEAATFECKLDNGTFAACSSPKTYTVSGGLHSFTVRATDAAGNSGQASYDWTVDTVAPTVTIGSKPSNPSNDTAPSFGFSANEPADFACKLDAGAFAACSSPKSYSGLADGSHTFTVRATDAAGNTGSASYTWVIETTLPTVTLAAKPVSASNSSSASFSFTSSKPATFECKLDAGAFASCTSPVTYTGLADGGHTFAVRAIDAANNTGPETTYTWTIDTGAPAVTITSHPANPSSSTSPSFEFSASEAAAFACKLDAGAFALCSSPKSYSGLANGAHTLTVRATDPAGNSGQASYDWTVDTVAPTVTISSKPNNPSNVSSPGFGFTVSEAATFACKLDAGAFAACSSPKGYEGLADGSHTFTVQATDAAGNTGQASYAWTVDTVAPTVAITATPNNPSNVKSPTFEFSAGEESTLECKLDAGPFAACSSPKTYSALIDGVHTFTVRATDPAGNTGAASYEWLLETNLPIVTLTHKPSDPSASSSATFAFEASKLPATLSCSLDGRSLPCSSPAIFSNLSDGRHTFIVKATDPAQNEGPPTIYSWTIDTTGPTSAVSEQPADPTNSRSATFAFSANEAGTFQCKLDDGAYAACSSPQAYANLPEGRHTFVVKALDALGNVGPEVAYAWTIETRAPGIAISTSPPDLTNSATASFSFAADEPSTFQCNLDDRGFEPCSSPASYGGLRDGGHSFVVRATDAAGNVAAASRGWTIDTTAPHTTIESGPRAATTTRVAAFTFSASEPASFQCRLDGAGFSPCSSPTAYSRVARGRHRFSVRAVDSAGNVDPTPATFDWTVAAARRRVVAASALLAPSAGVRVSGPPLLRWRRVARATYYNVQLYRAGRKVLSAWPVRTRLQLRNRWRFNGRVEHLRPGTYRWYVWPGLGNPAARRYGRLLGTSTFIVRSTTRRR